MARALLALLLILVHFPVAASRRRSVQHPSAGVSSSAIATAARQAAEAALKAGVPAVQVAVSEHGRVIYSAAFGMSDKESATAATPRSVLQVGSLMKQFTSATILRLAERGALTIDDRIEKFVPEYTPLEPITLRHLLTHTSGLAAPAPDPYAPVTREQFIKSINGQPLAFSPGSKYVYSNAGYKLLGYAIESIMRRPFAEIVRSEFVLPLGLIDTGVCGTSNLPLPDGYGVSPNGTAARLKAIDMSVPFAAGALCTTASDLTRWSYLLANGWVVLPASYATMTTPAQLTNNTVTPYGLGLFLGKQLGQPAVSHTGGITGFLSSLIYLPGEDIAVAVIINANPVPAGFDAHSIALTVAGAALATP